MVPVMEPLRSGRMRRAQTKAGMRAPSGSASRVLGEILHLLLFLVSS